MQDLGNPPASQSPLLAATIKVDAQQAIQLKSTCRIGSASDMDLIVGDPQVSKYHCRLEWQFGCWHIVDVQELAGTYVNARKVFGSMPLCDGDSIKIGSTELEFSVESIVAGNEAACISLESFATAEPTMPIAGIAAKLRRLFNLSTDADLECRIAFVVREILATTGANLGYLRLPTDFPAEQLTSKSLRILSGVSLRNATWIEPDDDLSDQVLKSRQPSYRRSPQSTTDSGCIPIPLDEGKLGLLHLYSIDQPEIQIAQHRNYCIWACEILGLLIAQQQQQHLLRSRIKHTTGVVTRIQSRTLHGFQDLVRQSEATAVRETLLQATRSREPLLIVGAAGTGRTRLAEIVSQSSASLTNAHLNINCADGEFDRLIDDRMGLMEDHAEQRRKADRVTDQTLILRNVQQLPLPSQSRLESMIEDMCSDSPKRLATRIIAITDSGFDAAVQRGDLRARLSSLIGNLRVDLTRLCERRDEIPMLIGNVLRECSSRFAMLTPTIEPDALDACVAYDWPGNWCELVKTIEFACVNCQSSIRKRDLSFIGEPKPKAPEAAIQSLAELERQHIQFVLEAASGNKAEAAKMLKIDRSTLNRKIRLLKADQKTGT